MLKRPSAILRNIQGKADGEEQHFSRIVCSIKEKEGVPKEDLI